MRFSNGKGDGTSVLVKDRMKALNVIWHAVLWKDWQIVHYNWQ